MPLARRSFLGQGATAALAVELRDANPWVRLHAAIALDEMAASAKPAASALRAALNDANQYVGRVAAHALKSL